MSQLGLFFIVVHLWEPLSFLCMIFGPFLKRSKTIPQSSPCLEVDMPFVVGNGAGMWAQVQLETSGPHATLTESETWVINWRSFHGTLVMFVNPADRVESLVQVLSHRRDKDNSKKHNWRNSWATSAASCRTETVYSRGVCSRVVSLVYP